MPRITEAADMMSRIVQSQSAKWSELIQKSKDDEFDLNKWIGGSISWWYDLVENYYDLAGILLGAPVADVSNVVPTLDIVLDSSSGTGHAEMLVGSVQNVKVGRTPLYPVVGDKETGLSEDHWDAKIEGNKLLVDINGDWLRHLGPTTSVEHYIGLVYKDAPNSKAALANVHLIRLAAPSS